MPLKAWATADTQYIHTYIQIGPVTSLTTAGAPGNVIPQNVQHFVPSTRIIIMC